MKQQPPPNTRRPDDTQMTVMNRVEFYRDGYRRMQKQLVIMSCATLLSVVLAACLVVVRPAPRYFPTGPGCRIMQMESLNTPAVSDAEAVAFAAKATMKVYQFDFANYRAQFDEISHLFTKSGWNSFYQSYNANGILQAVLNGHMTVTGMVREAPLIKDKGEQQGVYTWVISVPMDLRFQTSTDGKTQHLDLEVTVARVPQSDVESGPPIRIDSLRAPRMTAGS